MFVHRSAILLKMGTNTLAFFPFSSKNFLFATNVWAYESQAVD